MNHDYYIEKIAFRSILKLVLIPFLFLALLNLPIIHNNTAVVDKLKESIEMSPLDIKSIEKKSPQALEYMLMGNLVFCFTVLSLFVSLWAWLCLKIYFLVFRMKLRLSLVPVAHDQKDAHADAQPHEPDNA